MGIDWDFPPMPDFEGEDGQIWTYDPSSHTYAPRESNDLADWVDIGHAHGGDSNLFDTEAPLDGNLEKTINPFDEGWAAYSKLASLDPEPGMRIWFWWDSQWHQGVFVYTGMQGTTIMPDDRNLPDEISTDWDYQMVDGPKRGQTLYWQSLPPEGPPIQALEDWPVLPEDGPERFSSSSLTSLATPGLHRVESSIADSDDFPQDRPRPRIAAPKINPVGPGGFYCTRCGEGPYGTIDALQLHIETVHGEKFSAIKKSSEEQDIPQDMTSALQSVQQISNLIEHAYLLPTNKPAGFKIFNHTLKRLGTLGPVTNSWGDRHEGWQYELDGQIYSYAGVIMPIMRIIGYYDDPELLETWIRQIKGVDPLEDQFHMGKLAYPEPPTSPVSAEMPNPNYVLNYDPEAEAFGQWISRVVNYMGNGREQPEWQGQGTWEKCQKDLMDIAEYTLQNAHQNGVGMVATDTMLPMMEVLQHATHNQEWTYELDDLDQRWEIVSTGRTARVAVELAEPQLMPDLNYVLDYRALR